MRSGGIVSGKQGQTKTEFIVLAALAAIASVVIVVIFSNQIRRLFSGVPEPAADYRNKVNSGKG